MAAYVRDQSVWVADISSNNYSDGFKLRVHSAELPAMFYIEREQTDG